MHQEFHLKVSTAFFMNNVCPFDSSQLDRRTNEGSGRTVCWFFRNWTVEGQTESRTELMVMKHRYISFFWK